MLTVHSQSRVYFHYSHHDTEIFELVDPDHLRTTSALVWGHGPTEGLLFCGTEENTSSGNDGSNGSRHVLKLMKHGATSLGVINGGEVHAMDVGPDGESDSLIFVVCLTYMYQVIYLRCALVEFQIQINMAAESTQ